MTCLTAARAAFLQHHGFFGYATVLGIEFPKAHIDDIRKVLREHCLELEDGPVPYADSDDLLRSRLKQDAPAAHDGPKHDSGKARYSLLPGAAIWDVIAVLEFGARKYKAHSWQTVTNAFTRYADALQRHLRAFETGEDNDADSGLGHVAHLACNALFLCWLARYCPEQVAVWRQRTVK